MKINIEGIVIDSSRLCTIANYAKKHKVAYTTIMNRMFRKKLEAVKISGIDFIIMSEEEVSKKLEEA